MGGRGGEADQDVLRTYHMSGTGHESPYLIFWTTCQVGAVTALTLQRGKLRPLSGRALGSGRPACPLPHVFLLPPPPPPPSKREPGSPAALTRETASDFKCTRQRSKHRTFSCEFWDLKRKNKDIHFPHLPFEKI